MLGTYEALVGCPFPVVSALGLDAHQGPTKRKICSLVIDYLHYVLPEISRIRKISTWESLKFSFSLVVNVVNTHIPKYNLLTASFVIFDRYNYFILKHYLI